MTIYLIIAVCQRGYLSMRKRLYYRIFDNFLKFFTLVMDSSIRFLLGKIYFCWIPCLHHLFTPRFWSVRRRSYFRHECDSINLFFAHLLSFLSDFLLDVSFPILFPLQKWFFGSVIIRVIVDFRLKSTPYNFLLLFNSYILLYHLLALVA